MPENTDRKNSEHGHVSHSAKKQEQIKLFTEYPVDT